MNLSAILLAMAASSVRPGVIPQVPRPPQAPPVRVMIEVYDSASERTASERTASERTAAASQHGADSPPPSAPVCRCRETGQCVSAPALAAPPPPKESTLGAGAPRQTLIVLSARWCAACRAVDALAADLDRVAVIDIDEEPALARQLWGGSPRQLPCFVTMRSETVLHRWQVTASSREQLINMRDVHTQPRP